MKKYFMLLLSLIVTVAVNAAPAEQLFLIGEPAGGWSANVGKELTKTADGVFELDINFTSNQYFGFASKLGSNSSDWNTLNSNRYGAPTNNARPEVDTPVKLLFPNSNAFQLGQGEYHFTVDTNTNTFTVSGQTIVDPTADILYIRGEINSWNELTDEYTFKQEGNTYTLTLPSLSGEFKIANKDWSIQYSTSELIEANETYVLTDQGSINCALAGDITSEVTLTFVKESNTKGTLTLTTEGEIVVPTPEGYVPETLYVLGNVNGTAWNTAAGVEMTKENTTFTIAKITVDNSGEGYGFFSFAEKISAEEGEWDVINSGYRYGAATDGFTPEFIENAATLALTTYSGANAVNCAALKVPAGEYTATVAFDKEGNATLTLSSDGEIVIPTPEVKMPETLYVLGNVNGTAWNTAAGVEMTKENTSFTIAKITVDDSGEGYGFFSFAEKISAEEGDWDTVNSATRYGAETDGFTPEFIENTATVALTTYAGENSGMCAALKVPAGVYAATVAFDEEGNATLTLSSDGEIVVPTPEIYVPEALWILGNVNGANWSTANGVNLTKNGTTFTSDVFQVNDVAEGFGYISFSEKIGAEEGEWDLINSGYRYGAATNDELIELNEEGISTVTLTEYIPEVNASSCASFKVPAGAYRACVMFDGEAPVLTLTKDSVGVEAVEVENNADVTYYNLQGVRVENPSNGVYIRIAGNKAAKVLVK